ncbi:MAG: hypothetical protein KDK70_25295 [Myxococcales bacterium]|nr:hypothetical protein [Myxococcales bacterium]
MGDWGLAEPELVSSGRDAYLILPDRRVAHRTADDARWEPMLPLPRCFSGPRFSTSGRAGVTDDGTLWVADGSCVSRWDGAWLTEDLVASIEALTTIGDEVVVVSNVRSGSRQDLRALHGGRGGWVVRRVAQERSPNAFFAAVLAARAPDDVVMLASRLEAEPEENSFRFDGRRWRRANDLRDVPNRADRLDDGRLLLVADEGVYVGWPGAWSAQPALPYAFVRALVGDPDDCWAIASQGTPRRPLPGGLTHWQAGVEGMRIAYPARGGARLWGVVHAWSDHDVVALVDGRAEPVVLPPGPAAWPSDSEAAGLRVGPALEVPPESARFLTLQERVASVVVGGARHALVARATDEALPGCSQGISWWLVRIEDGAATRERELGPASCADRNPLGTPQIESMDFDDDGRAELVLRVTASAPTDARNGMQLIALVVVDASDYRIEGAFTIGANYEPFVLEPEARLFVAWSREGSTLHREASAWEHRGSRARAPKLAPCTYDAAGDAWTCPGPTLEAKLFGSDGAKLPLVLPRVEPR